MRCGIQVLDCYFLFVCLFVCFWTCRENSQRVACKGTHMKEHRELERERRNQGVIDCVHRSILLLSSIRFRPPPLVNSFSTLLKLAFFFANHFVSRPCRMILGRWCLRLAQAERVLSDRQQRRNSDRTEMSIEHRSLRRMNFWKCQLLQWIDRQTDRGRMTRFSTVRTRNVRLVLADRTFHIVSEWLACSERSIPFEARLTLNYRKTRQNYLWLEWIDVQVFILPNYIGMYVYIYMYICTHTHIDIYIYMEESFLIFRIMLWYV